MLSGTPLIVLAISGVGVGVAVGSGVSVGAGVGVAVGSGVSVGTGAVSYTHLITISCPRLVT